MNKQNTNANLHEKRTTRNFFEKKKKKRLSIMYYVWICITDYWKI